MKYIFLILIFTNHLFASYSLFYSKVKLGEIDSFSTIKDNFFKVRITNSLVKFLLRKDFFIYHNEKFINKVSENTKFKKDKYRIIEILDLAIFKNIKKKEKLIISQKKYIQLENINANTYEFKYYKDNKIKTYGDFKILNNELISFEEKSNNILITKNK